MFLYRIISSQTFYILLGAHERLYIDRWGHLLRLIVFYILYPQNLIIPQHTVDIAQSSYTFTDTQSQYSRWEKTETIRDSASFSRFSAVVQCKCMYPISAQLIRHFQPKSFIWFASYMYILGVVYNTLSKAQYISDLVVPLFLHCIII